MPPQRDPIERSARDSVDLYDVSTWEPRSILDHISVGLYTAFRYGWPTILVLVALLITIVLLASPALLVAQEPLLGIFFALSVVPALALAGYIWYTDITTNEPLWLLVATFFLAVLFATFAALVNEVGRTYLQAIPLVGTILFFYLVVGPIEEAVKLLAVRVLAFRSNSFQTVVDGAVYGAVAGLGFATIENAFYITQAVTQVATPGELLTAATGIATVRALVGPGHVIYSAIAGYYLGLAKFNPRHAGPLVIKGLFVAAFVHATYNSTAQVVPFLMSEFWGINPDIAFVEYVVGFNLLIGLYLYRKIDRYRRTYRTVREAAERPPDSPARTEYDPPNR